MGVPGPEDGLAPLPPHAVGQGLPRLWVGSCRLGRRSRWGWLRVWVPGPLSFFSSSPPAVPSPPLLPWLPPAPFASSPPATQLYLSRLWLLQPSLLPHAQRPLPAPSPPRPRLQKPSEEGPTPLGSPPAGSCAWVWGHFLTALQAAPRTARGSHHSREHLRRGLQGLGQGLTSSITQAEARGGPFLDFWPGPCEPHKPPPA